MAEETNLTIYEPPSHVSNGKPPSPVAEQEIVTNPFKLDQFGRLVSIEGKPTWMDWCDVAQEVAVRFQHAKATLGTITAYAWMTFPNEDVISFLSSVWDTDRDHTLENLLYALKKFPSRLLPDAADPLSRVSVWMANEVCVHVTGQGRDTMLFTTDEQIKLIERWSTGDLDREDVRAIKKNRRTEIEAINSENTPRETLPEDQPDSDEAKQQMTQAIAWAVDWSHEGRKQVAEALMTLNYGGEE